MSVVKPMMVAEAPTDVIIHGKACNEQDVLNAVDGSGHLDFCCQVLSCIEVAVRVFVGLSSSIQRDGADCEYHEQSVHVFMAMS